MMQGFRKEKNLRFTVHCNGGCNHKVERHAQQDGMDGSLLFEGYPLQVRHNRPGTGLGHKNTEPGSTFTVLRFPFVICPFRSADAKSGKIVQKIPHSWHKWGSGS